MNPGWRSEPRDSKGRWKAGGKPSKLPKANVRGSPASPRPPSTLLSAGVRSSSGGGQL